MIQNYDHCLRFQVIDKRIAFIDGGAAEVVADNHGNICIHIEFDEQWDGCGKIARFVYNGKWTDVVLDADGDCMCPNEVVKKGRFSLGVYGAELKTTTPIVVTVAASILSESGEQLPEDPTPGIYNQILEQYAVTAEAASKAEKAAWDAVNETEAAIKALNDAVANADKMVAEQFNEYAADWNAKMAVVAGRVDDFMASPLDTPVSTYSYTEVLDEDLGILVVTIKTVGTRSLIEVECKDVHAAPGGGTEYLSKPCIPPALLPIVLHDNVRFDNESPEVLVRADDYSWEFDIVPPAEEDEGWGKVRVYIGGHEVFSLNDSMSVIYEQSQVAIPEVSDIRVGADGTVYGSAGTAVREQIKKVASNPGGGGGSAEAPTMEVSFTITSTGNSEEDYGKATADKTFQECLDAYNRGEHIRGTCEGRFWGNCSYGEYDGREGVMFFQLWDEKSTSVIQIMMWESNDCFVLTESDQDIIVNGEGKYGATTLATAKYVRSEFFNHGFEHERLGKTISDIEADLRENTKQIGDIDTALDAIVAIQEELIGKITFTINDTQCAALKGMTWEEWVRSPYNVGDAVVIDDVGHVYYPEDDGTLSGNNPGGFSYFTDVIIDGGEYEWL